MKRPPMRLGHVRTNEVRAFMHSDLTRLTVRSSRLTPLASVPRLARPLREEVA
jgi:hypothetical protein